MSSLQQFWHALNKHDWFYDYSDDYSVYKSGQREETRLQEMSKTSGAHARLYEKFKSHVFLGYPKPELPPEEE